MQILTCWWKCSTSSGKRLQKFLNTHQPTNTHTNAQRDVSAGGGGRRGGVSSQVTDLSLQLVRREAPASALLTRGGVSTLPVVGVSSIYIEYNTREQTRQYESMEVYMMEVRAMLTMKACRPTRIVDTDQLVFHDSTHAYHSVKTQGGGVE